MSNTVAYTPGEIADGIYTNEWANLKYTIPEGYAQLEASEIGYLFENATDENVGFYIVKSGKSFALLFEEYGYSLTFVDTEDYLDSLIDDDFKESFISEGYHLDISEKKTLNAAYREFVSCHVKVSYGEEYFYMSAFVTEINGRMTVLMAISQSATENEAMVLDFEAIN